MDYMTICKVQHLAPHREFSSVQFSPVAQSCLTLCNPMNRSTPGLPVTNHLLAMKTQKSQLDVTR